MSFICFKTSSQQQQQQSQQQPYAQQGDMKEMKMEKTPRYTQRERNMVLGFAAQYKDIIENKRTDAESNRKKDEVWRQIAKEFNARVYHQRSSKQLRQLYKNMKLLLKKDLCGNRTFMDLLNTLSQQESVAQYIAEQMSPNGSSRQQKFDDDYDDSKLMSLNSFTDGMDTDVIVIKSEDMSDNENTSQNGGNLDDMDDDDDDCLSANNIPEVCLEEDDDEIFATDLRQPSNFQGQQQSQQQNSRPQIHVNPQTQSQSNTQQQQQPEVTIQNIGGIRVGSIGNMANLNLKALQNLTNSNSALSITHANHNNNNNNNSHNNNNNNNSNSNTPNLSLRPQSAAEQQAQNQLLNGLGLSAVNHNSSSNNTSIDSTNGSGVSQATLAALRRASGGGNFNHASNNVASSLASQILMSLNASNFGHHKNSSSHNNMSNNNNSSNHHNGTSSSSNNNNNNNSGSRNNEYLMSLAIEERKRKIDLLNAQIDYWKTLTKMLDAGTHNPTPSCPCHFPGKVNGLQTQTSSS